MRSCSRTAAAAPRQAADWVRNNGNSYQRASRRSTELRQRRIDQFFGTKFKTAELTSRLELRHAATARCSRTAARGTRCRFRPTRCPGQRRRVLRRELRVPEICPAVRALRAAFNAELGYGKDIGDTTALPPFRQFFAGGPDSVRGYRESRLGPKDDFGSPYGGNMKVIGPGRGLICRCRRSSRLQRAAEPVLRHRQRVLDRQTGYAFRRPVTARAGRLRLRL